MVSCRTRVRGSRQEIDLTKLVTDVGDFSEDADVIFDALFSQSILGGGDIPFDSPPDLPPQVDPSVRTYPDDGAMYVVFLKCPFYYYSPHLVSMPITFLYIHTFLFYLHQRRPLETSLFRDIRIIWMAQEASRNRRHPSVWPSQQCWH